MTKSSVARIEIDVTTTRSARNMRLRAWTRGEEEVLVLIEAPPREAGTATLRVGNNLWNYLPKIARTIRVPPAAMLGSWMGTDFTNDDVVKESSLRKDFAARYLTIGRHAIGATGSYEASPEFTYAGQWLHNPGDGSGIVAPALTYTFNDAVSLLGTVYVAYGQPPDGGRLRSEYGAAPSSGLLQLRLYF